jgi:hypothetical protein
MGRNSVRPGGPMAKLTAKVRGRCFPILPQNQDPEEH